MRGGEVHSYRVPLERGEFLHAVADQRGVDVVLTLFGPDAEQIKRADSSNGAFGPESLSVIADSTGDYRLEVGSFLTTASAGRYVVQTSIHKIPSANDRRRIEAEDEYFAGMQLQSMDTAAARKQAVVKFQNAAALWRVLGDSYQQEMTIAYLGWVYDLLGRKQDALHCYQQALPIQRSLNDRSGEARTLSDMARAYSDLGEKGLALKYYRRALAIDHEAANGVGEARMLDSIGLVYSDLGEGQKALAFFLQALPFERATGDLAAEGSTLANIGLAYTSLGENQKALDYYNQALPVVQRSVDYDRYVEAVILRGIGVVYQQSGEKQKALEYYQRALKLQQAKGDRAREATTLNYIGDVYNELGEKQNALDYYNQGLVVANAAGSIEQSAEIFYSLMSYWKAQQRPALAILFGKEAIDRYQQVRRNIQDLEKETQQSFVKSKEGNYRELAGLLISQGRLPEAQQVLDMLKLEEFSEHTLHRGADSSPTEPVEYDAAEQSAKKDGDRIEAEITALGREFGELDAHKATLSVADKKRYDELSAQLQDANGRIRRYFADFSSGKSGKSLNEIAAANRKLRDYKGETTALQHLLAKSDPGTVAIYTVVSPDRLSEIVITPNAMFAHDVMISAQTLRGKVSEFKELFAGAAPSDGDVQTRGQALYQILFEPEVRKALDGAGAKTLLWSLDDVLRYVPTAALWDGKQYLAERYQNVELTTDRSRLLDPPQMTGAVGLAMGVSKVYDPTDHLGPLPAVPGELDAVVHSTAVHASHGPIDGSIMLDDSFTEKSMEEALASRPKVVHIASHYVFEAGSDENSYLLLGGKDTGGKGFHLTLAELEDNEQIMFDGVELVTLSGCQTALGANDPDGHEVDALGIVATQQKDAKAVMATLWKVDDASAGLLMETFYKLWLTTPGMTKAEALRQAQLALFHGSVGGGTKSSASANAATSASVAQSAASHSSPYANPYYWAPFILIGNWK